MNSRDSGRPRPHLRYVGIQPAIAIRYRTALRHFFAFLDSHHIPAPRTLEDLDDIGAEYINELYQDDRPLAWAGDFMCGIKRFYPRCRRAMGTTNLFYKNWAKSITRSRALPLSGEIVMAISSFALLENDVEFSAAALVSFVGLLRSGEICGLTGKNVQFHGNFTLASISLPSSKGAARKGEPELVCIHDKVAIRLLAAALRRKDPSAPLLPGGARRLNLTLKKYAKFLGISEGKITAYGFRRGGASWHFTKYHSYDLTQELGRWQDQRTARIYIDGAVQDVVATNLSDVGRLRVKCGMTNLVR